MPGLKIEHLVKAEVPTGETKELPFLERARELNKLLDPTLPEAARAGLTSAINELREVSGYEAVSQTLQGTVVAAPTEAEFDAMSPEAKKQWAISQAVKGCGVADMSQLREVADALGAFAIIPYSSLSPTAFENEEPEVEKAVTNFDAWARSLGLESWVLAPIPYYDVDKHVAAGGLGVPYAGKDAVMTMQAVQMTLPVLIGLSGRVGNLETRVGSLEGRMGKAEASIKANADNIAMVKQIAEQQQAQLIQAKATIDAQALKLANVEQQAELARRQRVFNQDPLIFALPAGENVLSSLQKAILGPCWGPDIDAIVAAIRKLVPAEGHRAYGSIQLWARAS